MRFRKLPPVVLGCVLALAVSAPASAFAPFQMGIHEPDAGGGDAGVFGRMQEAHATIARTAVLWSSVAPDTATRPAGFDARNPADPRYNWGAVDAFVRAAAAHGMEPLLTTYHAPAW